jgi:hypothetical protein
MVLSGQLEYIEKFRSGAGRGWFLMNFWGLLLVFQPLAGHPSNDPMTED